MKITGMFPRKAVWMWL